MPKTVVLTAAFVLALALGFGLAAYFADSVQAKPTQCLLHVEPFYVCEPHPSCHNPGEMRCWLCLGHEPSTGEPCLCTRVGCMIPPG